MSDQRGISGGRATRGRGAVPGGFYVSDERLEGFGERVDDRTLIVIDGERGRNAFQAATGTGAMEFAKSAMSNEGRSTTI